MVLNKGQGINITSMKIILKGNPISTNALYKFTCNRGYPHLYMSKEGTSLKEQYQWSVKTQYKGELLFKPIKINIKLYFKYKIKHDWDNYHKIAMDSLTGIVWDDDSQIREATVKIFHNKDNPRIELNINIIK
jgi:Holliday junction resolvase RusA-like endonuclease